jgi:hypothetical protein
VHLEINLTPQAFSYPTVGNNNMIYCAPYGLTESVDYMIKYNPTNHSITKISLEVDSSTEKWQKGIVYRNKIYFLPYNESKVLVLDTNDDSIEYLNLGKKGQGKYIQGHIYGGHIIALPYGEHDPFNYALDIDMRTNNITTRHLALPDETKRWHTTQMLDGIIYGLPRGENLGNTFNLRIEYDCFDRSYKLIDMSPILYDYRNERHANKKWTTLAKANGKLYAAPYCEYKDFDLLAIRKQGWEYIQTKQTGTSRKYFSHTVTKNGKIFFPPAGHDEDWSEMLVINSITDDWYVKDLGIGKESKKYFAGVENSKGKLYYIPRGGCVCEPEDTWKSQGDLAEILVIDTNTEEHYTIDVSKYFTDSTSIEKYNQCVIINDIIYAFPYGESDSFQTILIFDTIKEKVIKTIDLNDI